MNVNTSDISICATALLELGSRPINSFNENNEGARLCANMFNVVRDEMLRQHPWSFAKQRVVLSPDMEAPAFGYSYQFTLPSDFIRLIEVNGQLTIDGSWPQGYTIENGKLLANTNNIQLRYVYRHTQPQFWDASFIRLVILSMKKALAYPITHDPAVRADAEQEWAMALKFAKTINGQELPPAEMLGDAFIGARY